jgi:hypothetical protein
MREQQIGLHEAIDDVRAEADSLYIQHIKDFTETYRYRKPIKFYFLD